LHSREVMKINDIKETVMSAMPRHWTTDRVLQAIGLELRRSRGSAYMPAIVGFGAGVIVGGALGLLFAPRSGMELRAELAERLEGLFTRAKAAGAEISDKVDDKIGEKADKVDKMVDKVAAPPGTDKGDRGGRRGPGDIHA